MAKNKFSKMYMLEVKSNKTSEKGIDFLIKNLVTVINLVYPSAKVTASTLDREE